MIDNYENKKTVYMVAGEASGDLLGAAVIGELNRSAMSVQALGIGGPGMIGEGFQARWKSERLSVFGYVEVLRRLPELLWIRRQLAKEIIRRRPAAFLGIDSPDFNLDLELVLKREKIPTFHLVSPSIWAWRAKKIGKIKRAVDHMLCLFPFEVQIYRDAGITATYIGHPLADIIPMNPDVQAARELLDLPLHAKIIAVLPGSRAAEVDILCPIFLAAMRLTAQKLPGVAFVIPAANSDLLGKIKLLLRSYSDLKVILLKGDAHLALAAANAVLLASGTATLEAALFKKPMVIAYKVNWITGKLMLQQQGKIKYIGLPNVLAGRLVVPEFIQDSVNAQTLSNALLAQLNDKKAVASAVEEFEKIHTLLKCNAAQRAAILIMKTIADANSS